MTITKTTRDKNRNRMAHLSYISTIAESVTGTDTVSVKGIGSSSRTGIATGSSFMLNNENKNIY